MFHRLESPCLSRRDQLSSDGCTTFPIRPLVEPIARYNVLLGSNWALPRSTVCCYCKESSGRVIMALYAQTTGTHTTNSSSFVAIPGLTLTLPEGSGTFALVI